MDPKLIKAFLISFLFLNLYFLGFPAPLVSQVDPADEWNLLYPKIRDRLISKEEAQHKLKKLEVLLKDFYLKTANLGQDDRLCFPLKGYGHPDIIITTPISMRSLSKSAKWFLKENDWERWEEPG